MKTFRLLDNLEFHDEVPFAQPLLVNDEGRVLRFTLRPGQVVREHEAPHSPVYIVIIKGEGFFAGTDGVEARIGPDTLIVFDSGEKHSLRADKEELVCLVILHGVPTPTA